MGVRANWRDIFQSQNVFAFDKICTNSGYTLIVKDTRSSYLIVFGEERPVQDAHCTIDWRPDHLSKCSAFTS